MPEDATSPGGPVSTAPSPEKKIMQIHMMEVGVGGRERERKREREEKEIVRRDREKK